MLLKTVVSALLLTLLLVTAKCALEHHLAPSTSGIHGALRQRWDVLLVGSSHTRQGYDVRALETATGESAYAVAYDGLDATSMLPVVQTLLADPARRPRLLVVEANAANLARVPDIQDPRLFFDAPPSLKLKLMRMYLRSHPGSQGYLDMWTLAANRGSDSILAYPLVYRAIDRLSYNGGYIDKTMAGVSPKEFGNLRIPLKTALPDATQLQALRSIAALAVADQVTLLFAEPPMPAPVEAQPEVLALHRALIGMAVDARVVYYDGAAEFPTRDATLFHDSNHLSTAGRSLYTTSFAKEVERLIR